MMLTLKIVLQKSWMKCFRYVILSCPQRAYDVVSTSILGWNNIATSTTRYQRCCNVVLKTLHQRYRMDVVSTWNQGWCFDVNWQPKCNVVSTLFLGRCINVVEWKLFQRRIRVDFSTSIGNQIQRCFNIVFRTLHQRCRMDVVSTWNQGWFFDVNWQPKFNVVSTLLLGRCVNVVELTLFQRGIRVDVSTSIGNQNSTLFQHCS